MPGNLARMLSRAAVRARNRDPLSQSSEEVGGVWQGERDGPPFGDGVEGVQTLGPWQVDRLSQRPHTKTAHNRTPRQHSHTQGSSPSHPAVTQRKTLQRECFRKNTKSKWTAKDIIAARKLILEDCANEKM